MPSPRLALLLLGVLFAVVGGAAIAIGTLGNAGGVGVPVATPGGVLLVFAGVVVVAVAERHRLSRAPRTAARLGAGLLTVVCAIAGGATAVLFTAVGGLGSNSWVLLVAAAMLVLAAIGFGKAFRLLVDIEHAPRRDNHNT